MRRRAVGALGACLAASLVALGCTARPEPWRSPDAATFEHLRGELLEQRARRPARPWAAGIHVLLHEPRTGRVIEGRGAMAVAPGRAVRMILLGGAGSTMLDVWVSAERWRVAAPPLGVLRRGTIEPPDLPVGFLRWWFTEPLAGALVAAEQAPSGPEWLLRGAHGVVRLASAPCPRGQGLLASRRAGGEDERVLECRADVAMTAGDYAAYEARPSGLSIDLRIESVSASPPEDAAFVDPDDPAAAGAP